MREECSLLNVFITQSDLMVCLLQIQAAEYSPAQKFEPTLVALPLCMDAIIIAAEQSNVEPRDPAASARASGHHQLDDQSTQ